MLVRDEADIVGTTVHHLAEHVDEILVADNLSTDGTREILDEIAASGIPLVVEDDPEPGHYQGRKTTALAMKALERGHRWVVPCDADEIWLAPEHRRIADWLDGIGREIVFVKGLIYNHVATAKDTNRGDPVRRLVWRQRTPLDLRWGKVACRLRPDLEIGEGNHDARSHGTGTTGGGLEIRHFPYRSPEQFVQKAVRGLAAFRATDLPESTGAHWRAYGKAVEDGGEAAGRAWFLDSFWAENPAADDSLVLDPAPVSRARARRAAVRLDR